MSNENKRAREELERLYGAECFIDKLGLRKIYTGTNQVKKLTGKERKAQQYRKRQLTYHHILEKSKGGKATIENGAILSAENHAWFHQQPKEAQREMNQAFQDYKRGIPIHTATLRVMEAELEVENVHQITFEELGVGYVTIKLQDDTEEDREFLDVTEGMTDEEIAEYERYKKERVKRTKKKFRRQEPERPHAHIDEEWQKEIMNDVLDELRY